MKKTQSILLKLLANELFGANNDIGELTDIEWNEVFAEAKQQAVTRIAYLAANRAGMPKSTGEKWRLSSLNNVKSNIFTELDHAALHDAMTQENIPYVILKGCSSAYYYPTPIDRAMGDVDFLVKKEDVEHAGKALEAMGLKPWDIDHICHIVYKNDDHHYELHFDLSGVPNGKPGELVHEYIKDIFDKSFLYSASNGEMILPSKFHHGLIILLHTSHHLTGEGVGLRHLCDWAVFVESCSDEEFKELFEDKFRAIGMWKFAGVLTEICVKYLGCTRKSCFGSVESELTEPLIEDILFGGNFGGKDPENRLLEARMISDRGKSGMNKKSMAGYFIGSVNESVRNHWPVSRKLPIIIPFGWVYFGTQKLIKGAAARTSLSKSIGEASRRKALYAKLGIFEAEDLK